MLTLQASGGAGTSEASKDEYIESIAVDILSKLPPLWDTVFMRKEKEGDLQPTQVVLFQELERFNILILRIESSLNNLRRALKGEIGMSAELDDLAFSLFNSFLPSIWAKLAP